MANSVTALARRSSVASRIERNWIQINRTCHLASIISFLG